MVVHKYILIQSIFVPNMNLKYFHAVEFLHNSFVAKVTVFPSQSGKPMQQICSHKAQLLHNFLIAMETVVVSVFMATWLSIYRYCHKEHLCQI